MKRATTTVETSPSSSPSLPHSTSKPLKSILKISLEVAPPPQSPELSPSKAVHFTEKIEYKQRTASFQEAEEIQLPDSVPSAELVRPKGSVCCELF